MGILVCGLNGAGKSTLGRMLAGRMGYKFIDNEDLYFPKADSSYMFSCPRSEEEVIRLLEEIISEKLIASLDRIILVEVPKQSRSRRIRDRSYQKFGNRILPGRDLYERENKWFSLADSRPESYVSDWLETVDCPVIRVDGTLPAGENADFLVSVLSKGPGGQKPCPKVPKTAL